MDKRKYYAASKLLENGENELFSKVIHDSYEITAWISGDYPDHTQHFYGKYVPGIFQGEREIISCYVDGEIAATAVLKRDAEENKICTFYVRPEYRRQGIAKELVQLCFDWLRTTKPLITIADYKLGQFAGIIKRYGWTETQVLEAGYYNSHSKEHVFNGHI